MRRIYTATVCSHAASIADPARAAREAARSPCSLRTAYTDREMKQHKHHPKTYLWRKLTISSHINPISIICQPFPPSGLYHGSTAITHYMSCPRQNTRRAHFAQVLTPPLGSQTCLLSYHPLPKAVNIYTAGSCPDQYHAATGNPAG